MPVLVMTSSHVRRIAMLNEVRLFLYGILQIDSSVQESYAYRTVVFFHVSIIGRTSTTEESLPP